MNIIKLIVETLDKISEIDAQRKNLGFRDVFEKGSDQAIKFFRSQYQEMDSYDKDYCTLVDFVEMCMEVHAEMDEQRKINQN